MFSRLSLWLTFAMCLAVVLTAMGWVSLTTIRLERAETEARNVRLALWRIDTALTPLLTEESAHPIFAYWPFMPAGADYGRMLNVPTPGGSVVPSPLLLNPSPDVLLHFQYGPDGRLTSPELPTGPELAAATPKYLSKARIQESQKRLASIARAIDPARLTAMLPPHDLRLVEATHSPANYPTRRVSAARRGDSNQLQQPQPQSDFEQRNAAITQNQYFNTISQQAITANRSLTPTYDITGVLMTPLWIDGRLLLARRFTAGDHQYVQGCWLDWPAIRAALLDQVVDLFPNASLEPADANQDADESRRLAALPMIRLVPGPSSGGTDATVSPIMLSLAAAWICVTIAAAAVAVLLWGVLRLSERRAAFVSAVTHELRTPLTTFQMYAEMLAEGMVPGVEQQHRYLCTLRNEAIRLTHLVENVLAYARLERGRTAGRIEPIELAVLVDGMKNRLHAHAEQAGMMLAIEGVEEHGDTMVLANRSAVEQVLFNLVDNACKYAGGAADKRILISMRSHGRFAAIAVHDHGPGLSPTVRRRLFRSFSKTAEEAAVSAPGIGLGLALSRRLARDMGGDLRFDSNAAGGASFILDLPVSQ